jgi:hypothetical protein
MEKTPTNTPAGGKVSRSVGGNGGNVVPEVSGIGGDIIDDDCKLGGDDDAGTAQYARHGKGALSGLRIWIKRSVRDTAKTESNNSVKTCLGVSVSTAKAHEACNIQ